MEHIRIRVASTPSVALVQGIDRLVTRSSSSPPPGAAAITEIVGSPATKLVVAERNGEITGCLTLTLFTIPTGCRAIIEDVLIDESESFPEVCAGLLGRAVELANERGARTIDVFAESSSPVGDVYEQLGFARRASNFYSRSVTST